MKTERKQSRFGGEKNLARRIAREREKRGLSYEALAKLVTEAGCSMQASAFYKIEKTDPPRRIAVDELLAMAEVFDVTVEDLLTPVEVLDDVRAKTLVKELETVDRAFADAVRGCVRVYTDFWHLVGEAAQQDESSRDLLDYVLGHRPSGDIYWLAPHFEDEFEVDAASHHFGAKAAEFYLDMRVEGAHIAGRQATEARNGS